MKKLLALVLALVMTLGLATVSSNAAFSDADKIQYTEAVDVMSAIGVLAGMDDGSFQPDGNLTREQGAKIIAYMVLGPSAADALTATKAPFADVAADRWSAGVVQYCVAEGIIAGVGDNKFDPTGALTGYAFAKMALVALGYRADIEGLTGADWSLNTATLIRKTKLADGIDAFVGSATLNRETAAQMGLNTLKATEVYYSTNNTVDSDGTSGVSTNIRAQNVSNTAANDYRTVVGDRDTDMQLVEDVFPKLKLNGGATDNFGRPANKWTLKGVSVGTFAEDETIVYTAKMNTTAGKKQLKADLKDFNNWDKSAGASRPTLIVNGFDAGLTNTTEAALAALTGNGRKVEFFVSENAITKIVVTDTVLGKVTNVDTKNSKISIKAEDTVGGNPAGDVTITTDKGYGKFVKDDYILVTFTDTNDGVLDATNSTVRSVAKAESVKGIASTKSVSDGSYGTIKLDGTVYTAALQIVDDKAIDDFTVSSKNAATLYLDSYGYILYAKPGADSVKDKAIAASKIYQSLNSKGEIVYMAKGYTSGGEEVTWQLTGLPGTEATAPYTGIYDYVDNNDNTYTLTAAKTADTDDNAARNTKAKVGAGVGASPLNTYLIYNANAGGLTTSTKSITIDGTVMYYASGVKFIYADAANDKAVVLSGAQKVAGGTPVWAAYEIKDGTYYIDAVYVFTAAPSTATKTGDIVYVYAESVVPGAQSVLKDDGTTKYFATYDAWVDGEKVDGFYGSINNADGFYYAKVDSETGAYELDEAYLPGTSTTMDVALNEVITSAAGNIVTATTDYDLTDAKIVDCASSDGTDYDTIEEIKDALAVAPVTIDVMFNNDTGAASYVYVTNASAATAPTSVTIANAAAKSLNVTGTPVALTAGTPVAVAATGFANGTADCVKFVITAAAGTTATATLKIGAAPAAPYVSGTDVDIASATGAVALVLTVTVTEAGKAPTDYVYTANVTVS